MIYLLYGNDNTQKSENIKSLASGSSIVRVSALQVTSSALRAMANQSVLFGSIPLVVVENYFSEGADLLNDEILSMLKDSVTIFIFTEDSCTQAQIKKYKKYLADTILCEKKEIVKTKINAFAVADMYAKRDKVGTWINYINLVESGEAPEAISGMLFWKIKIMLLSGIKTPYSKEELRERSSKLVNIYHKAHAGETDMKIALEQFILATV